METERLPPNDPREWLNRARSNLVQAEQVRPGVYLEDLCFQAQQAAEKALKALLLGWDIPFPYVHDLGQLITLLDQGGVRVVGPVREAARLNPYAVAARYPGLDEPVTPREYTEALDLARTIVRWVESILASIDPEQ